MIETTPTSDETAGLPRVRWRPWRELAIAGLMVMDLCWVVPWYRSLTPATFAASPGRAFLVLGGILLAVHLAARLMNYLRLRMSIRRWTLIGLLVASVLAALRALLYTGAESAGLLEQLNRPLKAFNAGDALIPDELVVTLAALAAAWRGLSLSQDYIDPRTVLQRFRFGVFMFLGFVFINTIVTGETPGNLVYPFLFAGLVALAAARIWSLSSLRGGGGHPFDRRWFLGMTLATLAVVGLAALGAWFASEGKVLEQIGSLFLGFLALAGVAVVSPVIYLLPRLVGRLPAVEQAVDGMVEALSGVRDSMLTFVNTLVDRLTAFLDAIGLLTLLPHLKPLLLWGLVIAIGALIVLSLSRWLLKERSSQLDQRETLLRGSDLLRLLREALQERLRKLGEGLSGVARWRPSPRWLAAARIRRIYAQLMELCDRLGTPRLAAQTPLEFMPALGALFPGMEADLGLITQAYLRVRYGELPETRLEVDEVEAAWARLREQGQEKLSERRLNKSGYPRPPAPGGQPRP